MHELLLHGVDVIENEGGPDLNTFQQEGVTKLEVADLSNEDGINLWLTVRHDVGKEEGELCEISLSLKGYENIDALRRYCEMVLAQADRRERE